MDANNKEPEEDELFAWPGSFSHPRVRYHPGYILRPPGPKIN
jgi:hypothetical protein